MATQPQATIVITTKNRKGDLRLAIRSALAQTVDAEIIVVDDGSTDGTEELVRDEFSTRVNFYRFEESQGYIVQRNYAARLAKSPYIFSIDDDAEFTSPDTIAQTLAEFNHPRVGAIAIPYIDVKKSPQVHQRSPEANRIYATASYIGTAHALRRNLFLALGAYRESIVHQGEERDYCLRMLEHGYIVRCGNAAPIHHHESPRRDFRRMDFYGSRNLVLFAWHNVPSVMLPVHLLATTYKDARFGFQIKRPTTKLRGLINGYAAAARDLKDRRPVSLAAYRLNRELRKTPLPLDEIERRLPVMREVGAQK